ncbi:MAG: ATP-binding protein [Thermoplasmata archaeon]|nr:ATP-binding protein [Thermoplasmata archaeon]
MARGGLINARRGTVRGGERKQLTYTLTEQGRERLRKETRDLPLLTAAIPPPPNPFFGRRNELRELQTLTEPGRAVVFVEGQAGMGKTSLIARHTRRIKSSRVPFWFTVRPGHSPRHFTSALAHAMAPVGGQQLAYYSQLPRQPQGREVADLVQRAVGARGLLMILDDAQVAEPDLRKFVADFVAGLMPDNEHLLFIVGQDAPFFQPDRFPAHHLVLGGLDRAAAHGLTDRRGGLADRFEGVYQTTLGSPLLLQLAVSTPGLETSAQGLPAAVAARLTREELLSLLPVALANEPLPTSFVQEAGGISAERLGQLVATGIAQKSHEGRIDLLQIVRGALLARVSQADEREAHLRLSGFYARSHRAESVRERFLHLVAAESWRPAIELLTRLERTLLSLGYSDSLRNALRHLALAIPKGNQRVRALRAEAALLRIHSEYGEAVLSLRRAIVESEGDLRVESECLTQIVDLYVRMRQIDDAQSALEEARRRGAPSRRAQTLLLLSESRVVEATGDLPRAQMMFQQAFDLARKHRLGDIALEAVVAWSRLASLGGEREAALRVVDEGLPAARQSGRLDIVFNLMLVRARTYAEEGRTDLAEAEMQSIRQEAEALGYLSYLTYTLSGLCAMANEAQRWPEAVAYSRQTIALAERLGDDIVLGHTLGLQCEAEVQQGLKDEAVAHGERAVSVLSRHAPSDSLVFARSYLADAYASLDRREAALSQYEEAVTLARALGMGWWVENIETQVTEIRGRLPKVDGDSDAIGDPTSV